MRFVNKHWHDGCQLDCWQMENNDDRFSPDAIETLADVSALSVRSVSAFVVDVDESVAVCF